MAAFAISFVSIPVDLPISAKATRSVRGKEVPIGMVIRLLKCMSAKIKITLATILVSNIPEDSANE